jgi:hypothetical protein
MLRHHELTGEILPIGGGRGGAQQAPPPGALFGLPGITSWTEQVENNDQTPVTPTAGTSVPVNTLQPFKQTDIVFWWDMEVNWTTGISLGAGSVFQSRYAPYNVFGECKLQIQNMYANWHPLSGVDAIIWQMFRPMRDRARAMAAGFAGNNMLFENPMFDTQPSDYDPGGFEYFEQALTPAAVAANTTAEQTFLIAVPGVAFGLGDELVSVNKPTLQAGLAVAQSRISAANTVAITFVNDTAGAITPTAGEIYRFVVLRFAAAANLTTKPTYTFTLEIPASIFFDRYYDLTKDGGIISQGMQMLVSPQYMSGTTRYIQPNLTLNPTLAANTDSGPFVINGAGPTVSGATMNLGFRRYGAYASNNPAVLPLVFNWQYVREATQFSLSGRQRADIPIGNYGQILSVFVRLFDPSAASGGQPIALSTLTKCQLQFGSALLRYDDTPRSMQRRFWEQHRFIPPEGVIIWDLALDYWGRLTNAIALNTLTTAGILVHLEFSGALSTTAYAVVGVEGLFYVE